MGIDLTGLRALVFGVQSRRLDLTDVIMLGRQEVHFYKKEFDYIISRSSIDLAFDETFSQGQFAEMLLSRLGADSVSSIDASDYEGSSYILDFNNGLPSELKSEFSCFLDIGSIEHIFDMKQYLLNVNYILKVGGTVLIISNANGFSGHGLYQFSPEFFYSAFRPENGFVETSVMMVDFHNPSRWFLVSNPAELGERNRIPTRGAYYVVCFSKKISFKETVNVYQSDYVGSSWKVGQHRHITSFRNSKVRSLVDPLRFIYLRSLYQRLIGVDGVAKKHMRQFDPENILSLHTVSYPAASK